MLEFMLLVVLDIVLRLGCLPYINMVYLGRQIDLLS